MPCFSFTSSNAPSWNSSDDLFRENDFKTKMYTKRGLVPHHPIAYDRSCSIFKDLLQLICVPKFPVHLYSESFPDLSNLAEHQIL